ncbi:Emopamil-binding protein [Viridothelium virens]|uniref:Emopamil-binding protein n=1 Tax=Viridothelium virens TaxID=1048519 RepID=A0A6A6GZZ4_VIRVR|nr:Emopamil-binding protein [Viridothelium virens]
MSNLSDAIHPYYPLEADISGFLKNEWSTPALLATFATACTAVFSITYATLRFFRPRLPQSELLTILWFVLCGSIHIFFEGFFVANYKDLGSSQHPIGQMWKEYALSDSRYLTSDPLVLSVEALTAIFWGPLSFTIAGLIAVNHPLRHPLQALVSAGQIYGDILYYATNTYDHFFNHISYSRPEAFYFWVYYFLMNFFWIVIPSVLLCSSIVATRRAFETVNRLEENKKGE